MAKRKMVQSNLLKNSIAAYFAAIEIHNKPNITYRYETVTLLIMNAWELVLKSYIRKYVKHKSIFENDGHTINFDKALSYVTEDVNSKKPKSFTAIQKNLEEIEAYRNGIAHFYCDNLEPYIFMLVARAALNYVDFVKKYFSKDIMADEGLFILPLGFKLPFKPEDFLSANVTKYANSPESLVFIRSIVKTIQSLDAEGIDDSIVLGFDIYMESVKKAKNRDLLAAITSVEDADFTVGKVTHAKFSNDPNAKLFNMSDEEFRKIWKYSYREVVVWCRKNIPDFKQSRTFYEAKKIVEKDVNCAYRRRLDSQNPKSPSKMFYTDLAFDGIKKEYIRLQREQEKTI